MSKMDDDIKANRMLSGKSKVYPLTFTLEQRWGEKYQSPGHPEWAVNVASELGVAVTITLGEIAGRMANKKRMKKVLAVAILFVLGGCQDGYTICAKAGSNFTGVNSGMTAIDQTRQNGLISPAEETQVLGYFKFVNDADAAFLSCASAAHTAGSKAGSFTACATIFTTTLNNPSGLLT